MTPLEVVALGALSGGITMPTLWIALSVQVKMRRTRQQFKPNLSLRQRIRGHVHMIRRDFAPDRTLAKELSIGTAVGVGAGAVLAVFGLGLTRFLPAGVVLGLILGLLLPTVVGVFRQ